ncbi:hypothetical protein [Pseudorhizobium marinum]|uniref:hypothetical protein n=1 Tax=Pseudorhizobium marinum TaxID=1496690 RepID=UPI000689BD81|nr:hypothetical protein [Pseudorhizobium marinum]
MATSYYSTGTITLTNGSAVVTGIGTAWSTALIASGNIFVQAPGNPLPIATVDSDTQITAQLEWRGASGTYEYNIQLDPSLANSALNASNLAYLLSELRQGTIFKYDAAGTLADRDLFNGRSKGFSYLVTEGESAFLYVKASATSGDWDGPFAYGRGDVGPEGPVGTLNPRGTYSGATAYAANDNVLYNGSSWVALQSTTGNAPPTLPTTSNAYWSLLAAKGADGAGIGDVVGPSVAVDGQLAAFDGVTGKLLKDTGILPDKLLRADVSQTFSDVEKATIRENAGIVAAGKNLIINGRGQVNQRAYVSGTATATANQYTLDRWRVVTAGQNLSFAGTNAKRTMTAPAGGVEQVIEGASVVGGTYAISWTGTATCTVDGVAKAKGGTFTLTENTDAVVRFSSGTFTDVQVEFGKEATEFEGRLYPAEMALCQRYHERGRMLLYIAAPGATQHVATQRFAVYKRAAPTISGLSAGHSVQSVAPGEFDLNNSTSYVSSTWTADAEIYQ